MNRLAQLSKLFLIVVAIAGLTFVVTGNVASANNSASQAVQSDRCPVDRMPTTTRRPAGR